MQIAPIAGQFEGDRAPNRVRLRSVRAIIIIAIGSACVGVLMVLRDGQSPLVRTALAGAAGAVVPATVFLARRQRPP